MFYAFVNVLAIHPGVRYLLFLYSIVKVPLSNVKLHLRFLNNLYFLLWSPLTLTGSNITLIQFEANKRAHHEMRYPNVTWHVLRHTYFRNIFRVTRTCYISNGRRFTKVAFRILLLSTFRDSSINYFRVCSLTIHTRSLANTEMNEIN